MLWVSPKTDCPVLWIEPTLPCILHVRGLRLSPTGLHTVWNPSPTHLGSICIDLRFAIAGLYRGLTHAYPEIYTSSYTTKCTDWLRYAYSLRENIWHSGFLCAVIYVASCIEQAAVSLDLHTVWRSVSGKLLKSSWGSGEITTTLQHVFTCWASTVPQKGGYVKLLLVVIRGYWEWYYSIKQESSVSGE